MDNEEESQVNNQEGLDEDHIDNYEEEENQEYDQENQINEDEQNEQIEDAGDIEDLDQNIFEEEGRVLGNTNDQDTKGNLNSKALDENLNTEKFNSAMEPNESYQITIEADNQNLMYISEIESLQEKIKTLK